MRLSTGESRRLHGGSGLTGVQAGNGRAQSTFKKEQQQDLSLRMVCRCGIGTWRPPFTANRVCLRLDQIHQIPLHHNLDMLFFLVLPRPVKHIYAYRRKQRPLCHLSIDVY